MELVKTDAWESSAESWFREFPYRVGNTKWKWQLEAFTEVGKLPVPGAGWAVPWGPAGWAGVWRLRRGSSPLLKEEEKLRYGGRRKQGCEDSRHVLTWRRQGVWQKEAFSLSGPVLVSRTVSIQAALTGIRAGGLEIMEVVSCIQPGLVICLTLDNIHVSMLFS